MVHLEQFLEKTKFRMEFIAQIQRRMEPMIVTSFLIFYKDNNYNSYYKGDLVIRYLAYKVTVIIISIAKITKNML